jgi:hypothetical protein
MKYIYFYKTEAFIFNQDNIDSKLLNLSKTVKLTSKTTYLFKYNANKDKYSAKKINLIFEN